MLGLRAGAGLSPRQATHFLLLRQKKVSKEKATPSLRPLRCAPGQTCGGAVAGCAVELALLLRSAARTTTAIQFTKHARSDARATPQPPRRRRSQQGWTTEHPTAEQPHGPSLRSAQLSQRVALAPARWGRAKQWPVWKSAPPGSLLDAPGARRARGGMRVGARMLRELTHRSCPSGAPQARSEFCGAPRDRAPQVAPQRSEGVADSRVALSLVPFFRRRERKGLARRGDIPASALNPSTPPKLENELPPAPTSSARTGRRAPITIKTIAASAYSKSASSQNRSKIPFHHPFNHPLNLPTPSPNLPTSRLAKHHRNHPCASPPNALPGANPNPASRTSSLASVRQSS
ncbi:hypothetical protein C8C93_0577 [Acidovorax sp. 93]|nr:hypothetical protein C8C93_0577 [Acidovorax sp. 93]